MKSVLENFQIPLQSFFMTQTVQFLYATNGDFSSNACRKLKTISIKNRQDGIRVQMVVKLISKIFTNGVNWSWQLHWHLEVKELVWIMKLAFVYKQKYF